MAAYVGLNSQQEIKWVTHPFAESMSPPCRRKIDAFMGFPPEPQELRGKRIGHVIVNTITDRPWSQYFCCRLPEPGVRPEESSRHQARGAGQS